MNNRQLKEKALELIKLTINCTREFPNLQIPMFWDLGAYIENPLIEKKTFVPEDRENIFIKFAPIRVAELIRCYHLSFGSSTDHVARFGDQIHYLWKEAFISQLKPKGKPEIGYLISDEVKSFSGVNLREYLTRAVE